MSNRESVLNGWFYVPYIEKHSQGCSWLAKFDLRFIRRALLDKAGFGSVYAIKRHPHSPGCWVTHGPHSATGLVSRPPVKDGLLCHTNQKLARYRLCWSRLPIRWHSPWERHPPEPAGCKWLTWPGAPLTGTASVLPVWKKIRAEVILKNACSNCHRVRTLCAFCPLPSFLMWSLWS